MCNRSLDSPGEQQQSLFPFIPARGWVYCGSVQRLIQSLRTSSRTGSFEISLLHIPSLSCSRSGYEVPFPNTRRPLVLLHLRSDFSCGRSLGDYHRKRQIHNNHRPTLSIHANPSFHERPGHTRYTWPPLMVSTATYILPAQHRTRVRNKDEQVAHTLPLGSSKRQDMTTSERRVCRQEARKKLFSTTLSPPPVVDVVLICTIIYETIVRHRENSNMEWVSLRKIMVLYCTFHVLAGGHAKLHFGRAGSRKRIATCCHRGSQG